MSTVSARTPLEAVVQRGFLIGAWPWRSLAYFVTAAPPVVAAAVPLAILGLPWLVVLAWIGDAGDGSLGEAAFLAVFGGALLGIFAPLVAMPLAAVERARLQLVRTVPVVSGHRQPASVGLWPWLRTRYTEAATWREVAYACLLATVVPVVYGIVALMLLLVGVLVASPLLGGAPGGPVSVGVGEIETAGQAVPFAVVGVVLLPLVPVGLAVLAGLHGAVAASLLAPGTGELLRADLVADLVEVSRSRARLADAFDAERRRIERDLHDGAQQRLVSLTLQLGLARLDVPPESPAARSMADAHEQAKQLMTELREFIHGIRPQVLRDLGLAAALDELADQNTPTVEVTVDSSLPNRLPSQVEATAYFVVREALTNVVRHAAATAVTVTARQRGDRLVVEVVDDGRGGADQRRGTGLTGLADRVAAVHGKMLLSSPPGGPTVLRVELPCGQNYDLPSDDLPSG